MAKTLIMTLLPVLILLSITIEAETLRPERRKKQTRLGFYFHQTTSGLNATAVTVAAGPTTNSTPTRFGLTVVFDDPITVGPDIRSRRIGSAQGIYASASLSDVGFLQAFNLVFTAGKFNGSTVTLLGRNPILSTAAREMPIVGGTGRFRMARGFALATTYFFNITSGDAIVKYDVRIFH